MCQIDDRVERNPAILWRKIGSQIVTLNTKTNQYHVLNESAALIFEGATGEQTVEAMARDIGKRSKLDKEKALEEVRETVDGMVNLGLMVGISDVGTERARPAIREISPDEFKGAIAKGAEIACRSLLGA